MVTLLISNDIILQTITCKKNSLNNYNGTNKTKQIYYIIIHCIWHQKIVGIKLKIKTCQNIIYH